MKRHLLFKSLLLLCALVVGTNAWADTVSYTATSNDKPTATNGTTSGSVTGTNSISWSYSVTQATKKNKNPFVNHSSDYGWQLGSSNSPCTAFSISTSGISGTITQIQVVTGSASTSSAINVTVGGNNFGTQGQATGSGSTVSTQTFTGSASGEIIVSATASTGAFYFKSVTVTYSAGSGPVTYSVTYNDNGATSGTAPTDETAYSSGDEVTVIGNTGSLEKTSFAFAGWNTKADGTGNNYSAGDKFNISASIILYAKWNYAVTDGVFDFVTIGPLGFNYGSGVAIETNSSNYIEEEKTWTAGNVTMVTSGKYRWWYNGCELKLYSNTPKSAATFSVPNGYVITKIVTTGGNFTTITSGEGNLSGNTWTGASQSVKLSIGGSTVSFKTITVTYTTPKQTITPSYDKITYVTPYMMNFSNIVGLKAYVATSANASGVTMTSVEGAVPENTPLLLIGTANDSYEVPVAASATAPATNLLKKGDGTTVFDGSTYDYILYSDGLFHQIGSGTVATNKAYLHLDAAPSGARSLDIVFDDNETTGVNEVKTQKATGEYFNLAGQRVAQPTKGLYIVNGKKVIIK